MSSNLVRHDGKWYSAIRYGRFVNLCLFGQPILKLTQEQAEAAALDAEAELARCKREGD